MNNEQPPIDILAAASIAADQLAEAGQIEVSTVQPQAPGQPLAEVTLDAPLIPAIKQEPRPAHVPPYVPETVEQMSARFARERQQRPGNHGPGYAPRIGRGRSSH